jgi:hypothetical protein
LNAEVARFFADDVGRDEISVKVNIELNIELNVLPVCEISDF